MVLLVLVELVAKYHEGALLPESGHNNVWESEDEEQHPDGHATEDSAG